MILSTARIDVLIIVVVDGYSRAVVEQAIS
jgi:hypothetical protein